MSKSISSFALASRKRLDGAGLSSPDRISLVRSLSRALSRSNLLAGIPLKVRHGGMPQTAQLRAKSRSSVTTPICCCRSWPPSLYGCRASARFGLASLLLFISSALDSRSRTSVKPLSESAGRRVRGAGKGGALPAPPAPPYTSPRLVSFPLRLLQCLSQLLLSAEGRDGTPRLLFNADSSPREIALGSWCCPVPRHISDSAHLQNLLRAPLRLKSPRPRPGGAAPLRRQPASARSQQPPVRCTPRPEPEPDEKEKERERERELKA